MRPLTIFICLCALGVCASSPTPPAPGAATLGAAARRPYPGFRAELRESDDVVRVFVYQLEPRSGTTVYPETRQQMDASGIVVSTLKGSRIAVGDTIRFAAPAPDPARDGEARGRFGGFYRPLPRSGREAVFLLRRAGAGLEATATVCLAPTILAGENGAPGKDAFRSRARAADDRFVADYLTLAGESDDVALIGLTRAIFGGLLDAGAPDSGRVRLLLYDWAMISSLERKNEPAIRQIAEEHRAALLNRARRGADPFLIAWMAGFLPAAERKAIVKAMLERLAAENPDPPADDPPGDGASPDGAGGRAMVAPDLAPYAIGAVVDPSRLDYGNPDFVSGLVQRALRPDSILTEARAFARR